MKNGAPAPRRATSCVGRFAVLALVVTLSRLPSAAADLDFASRLAASASATEYWDITAQFQSGYDFFLRFIITNEGPGSRTAAAAGHLIRPGGVVVPIKFGRTSGGWNLSEDGRRLKIASAVLDVRHGDSLVEVDSDKHAVKVRLWFHRPERATRVAVLADRYQIEVMPPRAVRASIWVDGMTAPQDIEGTLALTHTWLERDEAEMVQRRAELSARLQEVAVYLLDITVADGSRRGFVVVGRDDEQPQSYNAEVVIHEPEAAGAARVDYPLPEHWSAHTAAGDVVAELRSELLRWDPLEVIPQPFRLFVSLRAQPQRIWADADVSLTAMDGKPTERRGKGLANMTYARPWVRR